MANFCSNCGMQIKLEWKVCPECGSNLIQREGASSSQQLSSTAVSSQIICRNCGKGITREQQVRNYSLCFQCFRGFKRSKRNKGTLMMVGGIISLFYIVFFIITFSFIFEFRNIAMMVIANIVRILVPIIPILFIIYGVKRRRKWKFGQYKQPPQTEYQNPPDV